MSKLKKAFFGLGVIAVLCWCSNAFGEVALEKVESYTNHICKKTDKPPLIDGDLSEWENIPSIPLIHVGKPKNYSGSEDHGAKMYLMYDEENLYFAAEVRDNLFAQDYLEGGIGAGDCIILLFDPLRDARGKYSYLGELQEGFDWINGKSRRIEECGYGAGPDDYQYGFALTKGGPLVWRWFSKPEKEIGTIKLAVVKEGKKLLYEISIPWEDIAPFKPERDIMCGFKVMVRDQDEGARYKSWLEWTKGSKRDSRAFGDLIFLPEEEKKCLSDLRFEGLTGLAEKDISGSLLVVSQREDKNNRIELQVKDKERVIIKDSKTIDIGKGVNLINFNINAEKLSNGKYNLCAAVYDSKGVKQKGIIADINKVDSAKIFSEFIKYGDYRRSLTDVSKLTRTAFIDIGTKKDEKYLDAKFKTGKPIIKYGQTVRGMIDAGIAKKGAIAYHSHTRSTHIRVPVSSGRRNLFQLQMYRPVIKKKTEHRATGFIRINGKVGTVFGGESWYIAECVVENPSGNYVDLEIVSTDNVYLDWIGVYQDGIENIRRPKRICAWNAPIREQFVRIAPNGRYFMFDDGRPIFPIDIVEANGLSALDNPFMWYGKEIFEEYIKVISPYMNTSKRIFRPAVQCPSSGEINEDEMRTDDEPINICRKYGLYTIQSVTCHIGEWGADTFYPGSEDFEHLIWWTEYLANRYKDETNILFWGTHSEAGYLQGNAYQHQIYQRMLARVLKAHDKNHLVGIDDWGYPTYAGDMNKFQFPMVGNEETIDWISIHPYMVTDDTILIGKYVQASCRNKKPVFDPEFSPIQDETDPFTSIPQKPQFLHIGKMENENTSWFEKMLYKVFDLQCGLGWWRGCLFPRELDAVCVVRKVVEKVNWTDFDPNPKIAVECIPYHKFYVDKDIRKIVLTLTREKGIPYDVVFEKQWGEEYDYIVRSPEDLSRVEEYRDIECNTWSKYLIDKNGRYALVWIKAETKEPRLSIKGLDRGKYLIDWISLKTGDIEFTEERISGKSPLKIDYKQKGDFVVYVHPKTNYTKDYQGFKFVEDGRGVSVLVGPEDVPLGMVYPGKETPLFAYMHLKEIVEAVRDRSGVSLPLKTPAELTDKDKKGENILLAGGMELNPVVKWLKDTGYLNSPLDETDSYLLISSPWNRAKKVLIIKGSREEQVVGNIDKMLGNE